MRTVLNGTATRLHRLRARDLPADLDLRQSYWRYVDASGHNLSAYDMRDMDIYDCNMRNVVLPVGGKTDWLYARRNDWTGAVIPPDVSSYIIELVREAIRQVRDFNPPVSQILADAAVQYLSGDQRRSWVDALTTIKNAGLDVSGPRPGLLLYPRITARLAQELQSGASRTDLAFADLTPDSPVLARLATGSQSFVFSLALRGDAVDRFNAAEMIRQAILQLTGDDCWVHLNQADPSPHVSIISKVRLPIDGDPFGWWRPHWPS